MSLILGIESSCDETAAAVVRDGKEVLSSAVASQIAVHAPLGGVVPELAAREHLKALEPVTREALSKAGVTPQEIDAVAVTQGPGLIPALLVGLSYAKGLAKNWNLPLIGVNHFMAHIYGAFLDGESDCLADLSAYPMLALVVSGGHSSLVLIDASGTARQLGCTIDDAAGEALDKGSKLLNLGYPGGPAISRAAEKGNALAYNFPRPLTGGAGKPVPPEHRYNFSFSGIKTALLYHVRKLNLDGARALDEQELYDTAASFQLAVVDTLVKKTRQAVRDFKVKTVVLSGGVACNALLRQMIQQELPGAVRVKIARPVYCTDNAAMVAGIAYHSFRQQDFIAPDADSYARLPGISRVPFIN